MKKTGWAILLALCCIGGYLVLPSNYYLRRALIHLLPEIDQYPIFENRTVKAGNPQPCHYQRQHLTFRTILGRLLSALAQQLVFHG